MHLEKVTSRSSEAGLAGWIASNDVTLFTMVLIMVIAMFLSTKVSKGVRENLQLSDQNATIAATLASTSTELESARDLLDRTNAALELTQEERDQLQQQLVEKLADLAALNAKLDALLAEKGELETQRRSLLAAKDLLTRQKSSLEGDRETLGVANTSLRERLEMLSAQLAAKVAALEDIEAQRERLKKRAAELDAIVASLKQKLREMNIALVESKGQAEEVRAAAQNNVRDLQSQVAASDKQAEDYLAQLRRATTLLQSLEARNNQLQSELTDAERQRQAELLASAENNRMLVGLKGPLKRVAILIDASGSMRHAGVGGSDRWAEAQEIAATWLQHLNVEQCVLIVYSSTVRTFPEDGSIADLRGEGGQAKREALLQQLKGITPGGWTNTHDAILKAYDYDVDTVLLFSDGAPSKGASGVYDDALARDIYELCREHAQIPINTIGLGNYFDAEMSTFLRTVASITGGAFRGE